MTKRIFTIAMFIVFARGLANAQVPSSPAPSPLIAPSRSVPLSFLPPPMEGTISLGIYNDADQLVRVLHQEAGLDEFSIGADALVTKWDGKEHWRDSWHRCGVNAGSRQIRPRLCPHRQNDTRVSGHRNYQDDGF